MTATTGVAAKLLDRIHETGYWRVLMHATDYDEHRIESRQRCEAIVRVAQVRLRGWDYPHIGARGVKRRDTYIQSSEDWTSFVELWRFYQSGQFVHQFAVQTDRYGPLSGGKEGQIQQSERTLDFIDVVYTTAEILQFARGLAYSGALGTHATILMELHTAGERQLVAPSGRLLHGHCIAEAEEDPITWTVTTPAALIIAEAPRLATDATLQILEGFNWKDPSRSMLAEDQRRLLEHRL